eukprot:TRINITY_DN4774_c0_g1_i1.p1 TRINITY_DN4774_c0_g1~~TRINITY_DN4774_c0_g1_i1.p1  ORF type:complete len:853 (+),score=140.07 TRINITY_DN4774_c0_g1_i1:149-2707(+)
MPLRPGLFELKRWAHGGPDGKLAFSSLAPDEKKVYVRQETPRATQKARWLRDSLSATGAALGSAVASLVQQREKVVEAVPAKSGVPDDLREGMMARRSPGQIPDDMDSLFSTANKALSPKHKDDDVQRWKTRPSNTPRQKFLTEASQNALEANRRANELRQKLEETQHVPCDEQLNDNDDDYDDDDDEQQSAWSKLRSAGTRKKMQTLSTLGRQKKAKSKMTAYGREAGGDPFLQEGQDLDSVASEPSLNRMESEASPQGRTLQEGEDLCSREVSGLSKSAPLPVAPRPKTAHVSGLTFPDDSSTDRDADARAHQVLGAVKKKLADKYQKKMLPKRSSTSRFKRPSQVVNRHSLHHALFGRESNETASTGKGSHPCASPRQISKNDHRAKGSSAPDSDATDTKHWVDTKQKGQSNSKSLPFKVISWSSQKRGPQNAASNLEMGSVTSNTRWETHGKPEHWILLDLQQECEVSSCSLRFTGTQFDPKNVTLMRGGPEIEGMVQKAMSTNRRSSAAEAAPLDTTLLMNGTWIVAKRSTLNLGPRNTHHKMVFSAVTARYWRLIFHNCNSSTGNIRVLAPLHMHGMPVPSGDAANLNRRPSLTFMFTEIFNLGQEERETRRLAREYAVPIDYAEYVRKEFVRYDTSGTGALDYADFSKVVQTMTQQKANISRIREDKIPESRLRKLWQNVDTDGSGLVEFNEFLLWFYHNFNSDSRYAIKSFHSNKLADSATENFYASMGCNRIRFFLDAQRDMQEAKERAAPPEEIEAVESFEPEPPEPAAQRDPATLTAAVAQKVRGQVKMKLFKNAMSKDSPKAKKESKSQPPGDQKDGTELQGENKNESESGVQNEPESQD